MGFVKKNIHGLASVGEFVVADNGTFQFWENQLNSICCVNVRESESWEAGQRR